MMRVDAVVIGAGAVGLACALELARLGQRVVIVERNSAIGQETSSRNSGVIHAGIYDQPGSLKAELCVQGRELLYARCVREDIPHRQTGKLIVASDKNEIATLEQLQARAEKNGAGALRMLDSVEVSRIEPRVHAKAALFSPRTGIVDAHAICQSYLREARTHGVDLSLRTTVVGLERALPGWLVETLDSDGQPFTVHSSQVVNAAGLSSHDIAALAGANVPPMHFSKGDYFNLRGRWVSHLVYPLPTDAGLGIHLTIDLAGAVRAGPDTTWVHEPSYDVDPAKAETFARSLQRFLPDVKATDLSPDYAGVRPKLHGPSEPKADFEIRKQNGIVHLLGIESPGLTASEAIGRRVADMLA